MFLLIVHIMDLMQATLELQRSARQISAVKLSVASLAVAVRCQLQNSMSLIQISHKSPLPLEII